MFRLLSFLLFLIIIATLCTWLLKNDGSVVVEWFGYRIQTSTSFAILSASVMLLFMVALSQFSIWILGTPRRYKRKQQEKKRLSGFAALTRGLAAIAAGDSKNALKFSKKAQNYLGTNSLTNILSAQSAQLSGDNKKATEHYNALMADKETEIIAIKGLLIQAYKDNDVSKAIFLAQKALSVNPDTPWAILSLVELYKSSGQWFEASQIIRKALKNNLIGDVTGNRTLAVIELINARNNLEVANYSLAEDNITKSLEYLPDFVPAILTKAKFFSLSNNIPKALKLLSSNWKRTSHPDILNYYLELLANEPVDKLIAKLNKLLSIHPHNQAAHLIAARIFLKINDLGNARDHIDTALSINKTKNACLLMAEVQRQLNSDSDTITSWLTVAETAEKDQCWHCTSCHSNYSEWNSNCNNCNAFDSLVFGYPADISQFSTHQLNKLAQEII